METDVKSFDFDAKEILVFHPYEEILGLPFPLYLSIEWRLIISTFLR
jgi:hypothetical protein